MKKANAVWGLVAAVGLVIAPVAAASGAEFPENTPAAETIVEVAEVTEAPVIPTPEEAPIEPVATPVVEVVEQVTPIYETKFQPYGAEALWLLPESWDYNTTPSYQPAIFPQDRMELGSEIPCGRWAQDDDYWIKDKKGEKIWENLGDVLEQGEDSYIYVSHQFLQGPECVIPPTPAVPTAAITAVCGSAEVVLTNPGENNLTASFVINLNGSFYGAYAVAANGSETVPFTFAEDTGTHTIEVSQAGTSEWKSIGVGEVPSDCIEPPVVPEEPEQPVTPEVPVTPEEPEEIVPAAATAQTLAQTGDDWVFWTYVTGAATLLTALGVYAMFTSRNNRKRA